MNTTKQIALFSYTPRVQEEHTKAEVVHLTPCLLGLGVLFNTCDNLIIPLSLGDKG